MTQKVFAQFTGINEGTLSMLLRDKSQPTLKILEAIRKCFPDISMDWLFDGKGPMYNKDVEGNAVADVSLSVGGATGSSAPLFDEKPKDQQQNAANAKTIEKETVKYIDKPRRKITEIRVFFDDQTWESFVPKQH